MKLHLGCGERYLKDYVNIDFPAAKHTVQKQSVADRLIDIHNLRYSLQTVEEIRLHHVFEHFSRTVACALLVIWHSWLINGGVLRIEVPDFEKMARHITNRFSSKRKKLVAERHIFGSQEAPWGTHFAGYTTKRLTDLLERYEFRVDNIRNNSWKNTANIEVFATKTYSNKTVEQFEKITQKYLGSFLLDNSGSERKLLEVWMDIYRNQVKKGMLI